MRLRWLLPGVLVLTILPSIASARMPLIRAPQYTIGTAFEPGVHAGRLVIAFYNPDNTRSIEMPIRVVSDPIDYDWLSVELSNATTTRTLSFIHDRERSATQYATIGPRRTVFEHIDLDPLTRDLPPGDYDVRVVWDGHIAHTKTFVPYRCGAIAPSTNSIPTAPSKLPYLGALAVLALLVAGRLQNRTGTVCVRVPCSLL